MTEMDLTEFCRQQTVQMTGIRDLKGKDHTWEFAPYPADVELAIKEWDTKATAERMGVAEHYAPLAALLVTDPKLNSDRLLAEFSGLVIREVVRRVLFFFLSGNLPPAAPWESQPPQTT